MKASWDWCWDKALRPPECGWACTSCQHPTAGALGPHSQCLPFLLHYWLGHVRDTQMILGKMLIQTISFYGMRLNLAWGQIQHGWLPCHGFLTMLLLKLTFYMTYIYPHICIYTYISIDLQIYWDKLPCLVVLSASTLWPCIPLMCNCDDHNVTIIVHPTFPLFKNIMEVLLVPFY